ncbi:MAG: DUF86 domain-containing protein [Ktedonobacterales bacterium]
MVRNLEIIGEAVKHLPKALRSGYPSVPWTQISGLRDILAHQYFGVSLPILWDIVQNEAPALRDAVTTMTLELDDHH